MKPSAQPPRSVPVLTEVVVLPQAGVADDEVPVSDDAADTSYAATAPAPFDVRPAQRPAPEPAQPAAPLDESALAKRVLADLERQLDLMFEQRLRETLTPVLTRTTDTLLREMRNQLATSLREMVARAVAAEIERLQKR